MKLKGTIGREKIVRTIDSVNKFTEKNGLNQISRRQLATALEEIMLTYMEQLGEEALFDLSCNLKNGDIRVCLVVQGRSVDPVNPGTDILNRLIEDMENPPEWEYSGNCNRVRLKYEVYSTIQKNLRFSWKYMEGRRGTFVIAVTSQIISVVLSIVAPILSAKLIVAYTDVTYEQIILIGLALLAVKLATGAVLFISNHSYNVVYNKTISAMEEDMVDSALRITKGCIDEQGSGLFIQRLTVDTTTIATGFNTIADMTTTVFRYLGILGAIVYIDIRVFFVILALLTMQGWIERKRTTRMNVDDRIYRESNERFTGLIGEMVRGAVDVKTLNSEATFKKELSERINDANDKRMILQNRSWAYKLTRMEIGSFIFFGFVILLAFLISKDYIKPVMAIVLFNYYSQLDVDAVTALGQFLEFVRDFNLSSERINVLLSGRSFPKERFGKEHIDKLSGEISFEHVYFAYKSHDPHFEARTVLNDMSFVIPAGTTVAFVGESGSGKSTTINLISKLHEVSRGTVRIDGIDIRKLDKETIRNNIAVVSQQPYIFNMSIRDNLRIVKPDITDEEMIDVCRKACIYDDIVGMAKGFDTMIGEAGVNISGGQRQRIAIARALIRNYKILLLDEATSSLDNINQARIQQMLENIHGETTMVIVAHRLSTVINADVIFLVEAGKIIDCGKHEELMQRCEKYRRLYKS